MSMADLVVQEELDSRGLATGVEREDTGAEDAEKIAEPFDPEDIDVVTRSMTVDLLLSRTRSEMIDLQPDFQRRWGVWDAKRQSRLIESLLLRIPLPVLYAAEDDDERWEVVDGIQRLSTIARFIDASVIDEKPLTLTGLEYLSAYDGKTFAELSPRLQLRLRETELVIHLIRKGTPAEVKINIFARINTGGIALSPQELRHAITPGAARKLLEDWAGLVAFTAATDNSVRAVRMDDRELVLRFVAFFKLGLQQYRQPEMDSFLIRAMKVINGLDDEEIAQMRSAFIRSMQAAAAIFGNDAFRKRYSPTASRLPINKALFEAISVNLATLHDDQIKGLIANSDKVRGDFIALCGDRGFDSAISQGTGDVAKVNRRFTRIKELFAGALA